MQTMCLDIIRTSTIIYDADGCIVMHYPLQTAHPTEGRNMKRALDFISLKDCTVPLCCIMQNISRDLCKFHGKYVKSCAFSARYLRVSHLSHSHSDSWVSGKSAYS